MRLYKTISNYTKNIWGLVIVNTVVFACLAFLLPIRFEENDDVMMCMIANGVYAGTPDCHLVFINSIFGWILSELYQMTNQIEWYTLSFCVCHIIAFSYIIKSIACLNLSSIVRYLIISLLYILWIDTIAAFQFTTTAGWLCCAGCILICKPELKHLFAGILAVLIASFIRFEAAALVAILFCPLFVECCVKNKKIYLHLLATLCLVILGYFGNKIAYYDSDWKRYEEYNQLRGNINDNPNIIDNPKLSKITLDDYRLFTSFEGDPNIVDITTLNEIKSQMNDGISWKHICDNWQALRKYLWVILCLGGILLLTSIEIMRIERRKLPPLYSHYFYLFSFSQ